MDHLYNSSASVAEEEASPDVQDMEDITSCIDRNYATDDSASPDIIMEEDYSSEVSQENQLNSARLRRYKSQFNGRLLGLIRESEFEFGYDTAVDVFIRERLAENAAVTKEWINSLFIENFGDVEIATGILRVIAHLEYYEITPQGPTIALAALSHTSLEVRECGVRAFENWATLDCLCILRTLSCPEAWMQEYVSEVVSDLEELLLNASSGQKD